MPDTVCENTSVKITNTSTGGTTFYWNFCQADLNQIPEGANLGNIGGILSQPVFLDIVSENGNYYGFLTDHYPGNLIRLDFGNSLLNAPNPVNLGNPGNTFVTARDLRIIKSCDQIIGFVAGGTANNLIRIDFNNDLTSIPTGTDLGNIGNFDFSHSLSKLFRVGSDLYTFVPNVNNNTLSRVRFPGCDNASFPNSALKDPPVITYSQPGTYRVNLIMDDGLETEASFCKTIVVVPAPVITASNDTLICTGGSVQLQVIGAGNYSYSWSPTNGLSNPAISNPLATPAASGYYYVTASANLLICSTRDSVLIKVKSPDSFGIQSSPSPANICKGDSIRLEALGNSPNGRDSWRWLTPIGTQDPSSPSVNVLPLPSITTFKSNDIDCIIGKTRLFASGAVRYNWYPTASLSDSSVSSPLASVDTTTLYYVEGKGLNGCTSKDSIIVYVDKNSPTNGYPMANAFTPNGDGHNDCFGIKYWGYIGQMEIAVFNRWGLRVFESKSHDACWDGSYNGHPQPAGTYVYIVKASTLCGNVVRKGTLELIR